MQIVIDINDLTYESIMRHPNTLKNVGAEFIRNGTPLPKGHGDLKDVNEIFEMFDDAIETAKREEHEYANAFESGGEWCSEYESVKNMIESIKPIIEADTEYEVWNGYHGQITAPKGTFEKIWQEADKGDNE